MVENLISYAQNGEDVVLARALRPAETLGTWIDVGAGGPVVDSVTKMFSDFGWRGINLEPAVEEFTQLQEHRPRDTNLQVAAGARTGTATFFDCERTRPGLSTTNPDVAERYEREGRPFAPRDVPMVTLADVFRDHVDGQVDFLKIDVEGSEAEVLRGADFAICKPRILVVEATVPNSTVESFGDWEPILLSAGYEFVMFDGLNRFYVSDGEPALSAKLRAPANVLDGFKPYRWIKALEEQSVAASEIRTLASAAQEAAAGALAAHASALRELQSVQDQLACLEEANRELDLAHARLIVDRSKAHEELRNAEQSAAAARELAGQLLAKLAVESEQRSLMEAQLEQRVHVEVELVRQLEDQLTVEREQRGGLEAELEATRSTKLFRWTATVRRSYAPVGRLLDRLFG